MTVEKSSGLLFNPECGEKNIVPFIVGSEPNQISECVPEIYYDSLTDNSATWNQQSLNNTAVPKDPTDRMNTSGRGVTKNRNSIKWSDNQQGQKNNTPIWEGTLQ